MKFGKKYLLILTIFLFSVSGLATAANYCVRAGATGSNDGSDWIDAYTDLPSTLERGSTYYIADGTYSGYTFNDAVSGTSLITIKKAIASDHGTSTGWQSSYGDGQAEFADSSGDTLRFTTDYWVFDGQVGGGPGNWKTGYGFRVIADANEENTKLIDIESGADYITISHVDMQFNGIYTALRQDCLGAQSSSDSGSSHLTISYNYMRDVQRVMLYFNRVSDSLVEYNYFKNRHSTDSGIHGEAVTINAYGTYPDGPTYVANVVIKYNVFEDTAGTGVIVIKDGVQSDYDIYGNVFFQTSEFYHVTNGVIASTTASKNFYMRVHDNTFVKVRGGPEGTWNPGIKWNSYGNEDTNYAYNNMWYNAQGTPTVRGTTNQDNNFDLSGDGSLFVDYENNDFHLAEANGPGTTLSSPFNYDMDGNEKGADEVWDIGAYEYVNDTNAPTPDPMTWATEPYAAGTSSISMTATTATDSSGVEYYFDCTAGGGNDSSWQDNTTYEDTGLSPSTQYTYRVKARDKSSNQNETGYSTSKSATTNSGTGAFQQDSGSQGIVSMEAENYDVNTPRGSHSWVLITTPTGCSGGEAMRAEPDIDTNYNTDYAANSPQLDFEVNFAKTGTHYVWIRGYKIGGTDDSCHAGLEGQEISTSDRISNFASNDQWLWTNGTMDSADATFDVNSTGVKTVNVWMREDGLRFDKIVLTVDANYTPTGNGPAESSRGGGDTTAPSPDPMTWATDPYAVSSSSISMTATTATDPCDVEYYFDCTAGGGNDSGWQDSSSYTDTGLSPSTQYSYQVKARDKSSNQNETTYSTLKSATTQSAPDTTPPSPDPMTWATEPYATGVSSISMTATTATDSSGVEYYFDCTAGGGNDSGWQDSSTYEDTGLDDLTQYTYRVKARDKSSNQNETGYSTTKSATTQDGTAPSPDPMTWSTEPYATGTSSISMTATVATDASGVEYYFDCTAGGGNDSGWQDSSTYEDTGLDDLAQYTYRVKARDKSSNQNETSYSTTKSATTQDGTAPTPDPTTWFTDPYATGSTSISMTATTATDASGVEYYFECTAGGGNSSGWQDSVTYEDTGLGPETQYTYKVQARDKSTNQNATGWSTEKSATTESDVPEPVSWWKLDESSGTNADDSSGNNHDGTLSGGSWAPTSGKFDGAVDLGDSNNTDYVQVPTTGMSASAGTVSVWGRMEGTQSGTRYFFGHTSGNWEDSIQLYMDNSDNNLDLGFGGVHLKHANIMTLSANTWYHIALTWDGTNYVVYVDGIEKASGTYTGLSTLNSIADIGNTGNTAYRVEAFQGLLDDVRIYDGALSKYDIADLAGITIASSPSPADNATDVSMTADLSWSAGYYAASTNGHDVYLGTDFNSVADANHSSSEFKGNQSSTTYGPGTMSTDTTYYWAIDEINDTNTWPGNVWSFTTGLDPNLVSWWKLDESSGTTAADSSGNDYDGTRSSGSWAPTSGKIDGAVDLGDSNNTDYVQVPTTGMSASVGTVSVWGRIEGTQSGTRYFFGHTTGSSPANWENSIQLYMDNGDNNLDLGFGGVHPKHANIMTLSANTWYHIALTWDGTNYIVYIDGDNDANGTYSGLSTLNSIADIGNDGNTGWRIEAFQGLLDQVRIYDKVLSQSEIQDLAGE